MKNLFVFLFLLVAASSCGQHHKKSVSKFDTLEYNLIQLCVDSTLSLDPGLNTETYLIDFSGAKNLGRQNIDSFLKAHPYVSETNSDSLVKYDTTWVKYGFFQQVVIRFDKMIKQKDEKLLINTSKTKASDGAIRMEIILQKQEDNYKCLKSEITAIS